MESHNYHHSTKWIHPNKRNYSADQKQREKKTTTLVQLQAQFQRRKKDSMESLKWIQWPHISVETMDMKEANGNGLNST